MTKPSRRSSTRGMQSTNTWPAWLKRWARRFLALPVVMGLASTAEAQTGPHRSVLNKNTISLPIMLDAAQRPHLKEVQLYVKDNASAPWVLKERVPPTATFFNYKAPGDGEYFFTVVTVDRAGASYPADVSKEPPAIIVSVDTTGPQLDLHLVETTREGQVVLVQSQDSNADSTKTRFFYQTGDKVWRPLDPMPGTPEQFCVPGVAVLTGMVRAQATDKAGNTASKDFNLHAMTSGSAPMTAVTPTPPAKGPGVVMVDGGGSKTHLTPPPKLETGPAIPPSPPILEVKDVPFKNRVEVVTHKVEPVSPPPLLEPTLPRTETPPRTDKIVSVDVPPRGDGPSKTPLTLPPKIDGKEPTPVGKDAVPAECHMANNTRIFLDYQIEAKGASGVGRVEIWMTRDRGQSWHKVGEDKDLTSPAEVTLPGEGIFGVSLVVTNGRGFGGTPPQPGDQADYWVEVDVTRPTGEILGIRPSGADDGSLFITWSARDKRLAADPIDLYFSTTREGPWSPIVKGIKNDGSYRWVPPRDMAPHAFIRMVVQDQAGNLATCETAHPVALDDLSRPRGRVLGVTTTPRGALVIE